MNESQNRPIIAIDRGASSTDFGVVESNRLIHTVKGLCSLLCRIEDPAGIETRALKGNASQLNLTISDLGYDSISFLGSDVTASNFVCLKSHGVEDLASWSVYRFCCPNYSCSSKMRGR